MCVHEGRSQNQPVQVRAEIANHSLVVLWPGGLLHGGPFVRTAGNFLPQVVEVWYIVKIKEAQIDCDGADYRQAVVEHVINTVKECCVQPVAQPDAL